MKKKERQRIRARAQDAVKRTEEQCTAYRAGALDPKRATGGLGYYLVTPGEGELPRRGERVSVLYVGVLATTGEVFDENFSDGRPFQFHLGAGEVIGGWDIGVALLHRGAQALLFIPPALGYGTDGYPPEIPGGSELVFYVEVL